jgi:hypothetical protein
MTVPTCLSYESSVAGGDLHTRRRRPRSWRARALFFLEVFGLAVLAMGGAMVLAVAPQFRETTPAISQAPQGYNDNYLELFAKGPGQGWYVLGHAPCAADQACQQP